MYLAVAASFLVAFGLGVFVRSPFLWTHPGPPAVRKERPVGETNRVAGPRDVPSPALSSAPASPGSRDSVRLVLNRGDGSEVERLDLPVYDLTPEDAWLLSDQNPPVPPDLRRVLQRAGGRLRWQRHLLPVQTREGRQVLVPLEQVEITPVGGQRYQ